MRTVVLSGLAGLLLSFSGLSMAATKHHHHVHHVHHVHHHHHKHHKHHRHHRRHRTHGMILMQPQGGVIVASSRSRHRPDLTVVIGF